MTKATVEFTAIRWRNALKFDCRARRTQQGEAMAIVISKPIIKWMHGQRRQHCIDLRSKAAIHRPLSFSVFLKFWLANVLNLSRGRGNKTSTTWLPRDICTRFERYLYSTKLSWIISRVRSTWPEVYIYGNRAANMSRVNSILKTLFPRTSSQSH